MATGKKKLPDFFRDDGIDPVDAVTGKRKPRTRDKSTSSAKDVKTGRFNKKKAGFYLSMEIIERFNRKFYELKLAGIAIDNKSTLLELALAFALDDLDKGAKSRVLRKIRQLISLPNSYGKLSIIYQSISNLTIEEFSIFRITFTFSPVKKGEAGPLLTLPS